MFGNVGKYLGYDAMASGLGSLFGGGQDPSKEASKYYNQIPGTVKPYFDPYINAGKDALGQLQGQYGNLLGNYNGIQGQYNQLMNDPNGVMNKIGGGYQQSPGFQFQLDQGMNAANNAAAAGGMAGSPQHQQQAATMATGLANQDYYNYMNHALGLYGQGLQGNAGLYGAGLQGLQGLNQMGYGASGDLAGLLGSNLMNQGNMAYQGAANQNAASGSMWGNLAGLGTAALMFSSIGLKDKMNTPSTADILYNVRNLALDKWKYKGINQEFIGPYAEEFTERFGVGDGKTINLLDAIGVLLGAVKELDKKVAILEKGVS
jgi:hypothetical protein